MASAVQITEDCTELESCTLLLASVIEAADHPLQLEKNPKFVGSKIASMRSWLDFYYPGYPYVR